MAALPATMPLSEVNLADTLQPLTPSLRRGLMAVAFFGFLSFATSLMLFLRLAYRLIVWERNSSARVNQFLILITNLICADIQQSVAFLLNVQWIRSDGIITGTNGCWTQGWFISTGDLASGVFTFLIATHCFVDIVFDYRPSHNTFLTILGMAWGFVYLCAIIGIALHPSDIYMRAGAWCWISSRYDAERLYLHYLWIIIAECGTFVIYLLLFSTLQHRVKNSYYASDVQLRAKSAMKLIIAYPIVYIICTLPLVKARLAAMAGGDVTLIELCVAGAMITSNGWIDVLLYSFTRRAVLFGPDLPSEHVSALDTFRWQPALDTLGTTTTIEANHGGKISMKKRGSDAKQVINASSEDLFGMQGVVRETIVHVHSETLEMDARNHQNTAESDSARGHTSFEEETQPKAEK